MYPYPDHGPHWRQLIDYLWSAKPPDPPQKDFYNIYISEACSWVVPVLYNRNDPFSPNERKCFVSICL